MKMNGSVIRPPFAFDGRTWVSESARHEPIAAATPSMQCVVSRAGGVTAFACHRHRDGGPRALLHFLQLVRADGHLPHTPALERHQAYTDSKLFDAVLAAA